MSNPVIANSVFCLAHVPDLVPYGSKPRRELDQDEAIGERLRGQLRTYEDAVRYPPNQTFIGNLSPDALRAIPRPWHAARDASAAPNGPFGEIVEQDLFYALLEMANVLTPPLLALTGDEAPRLRTALAAHPVLGRLARAPGPRTAAARPDPRSSDMLGLFSGPSVRGFVCRDDRAEGHDDENLSAHLLLEALCAKASGALALQTLLHRCDLEPQAIDYIISCGEEAVGDRYQRGGGGMAKSIGEMCGCTGASGMDIKNFCAAPASALVTAGALVRSGIHDRVAVVAGGSLAKLGMKFQALLDDGQPILGDCLGAMAILVTHDDGRNPLLHLEPGSVGIARVGASTSEEAIYRQLILDPLEALGIGMLEVDRFAPELHNSELMQYSGSGDVAHKNYRMIAAMAVRAGVIERGQMESFIERVGMPGFAPPQGHIPSGVPYLGHAVAAMRRGEIRRAMFICKASLFLNRITTLYDGVSFMLEGQVEH